MKTISKSFITAFVGVWIALLILTHTSSLDNSTQGLYKLQKDDLQEINCLAFNMYFEARGESSEGLQAVGEVTMNRYYHQDYPDSVCKVVKHKTSSGYQFSWMQEPSKRYQLQEQIYPKDFYFALDKAVQLYYSEGRLLHNEVLYFKRCDVNSQFFNTLQFDKRIGLHCFYK